MTSVVQVWTRDGQHAQFRNCASAPMAATSALPTVTLRLPGRAGVSTTTCSATNSTPTAPASTTVTPTRFEEPMRDARLSDTVSLRVRLRHSNSHIGVPGEWNFNGVPALEPPEPTNESHLN